MSGDIYNRCRQVVNARFDMAEGHCRAKFERFYRYERLINMVTKKKQFDWKANAFLPYAFSVAEQSAAMKWLALFTTRPYVSVRARKAGLEDLAARRESLLDWHFSGDVDIQNLALHMMRVCERYGKSVAVVAPEWDTRLLKYRSLDQLPTTLGPIARMAWKQLATREYKIRATVIDNTDFFPEPGRRNINGPNGMRWAIRRYYLTQDELLNLESANLIGPAVGGQSVTDIKDTSEQQMNEFRLRRLFLDKFDDADRYTDQFDRTVELLEYSGAVPRDMVDTTVAQMEEANGMDPFKRLIILANRNVTLMNIALPWDHGMLPFIEMDCVPDPWDFWGKGKVEPIEHLCYVGNEIVNMRLDNVKMAVNGLIGVDGNRMPAGWKRRLISQPFGIVETNGSPQEVIQRLMLGDVTPSSYTEQQNVFSLIQEASAINETLMGAPGPGRTLGEHQLKAESASKRLQFELVGQAQQLLGFPRGLTGFILGLDRQYLPIPTYVNVVEPSTPDEFTMAQITTDVLSSEDDEFAYAPTGATEGINLAAKRQDLAQMLQALQPMGPLLIAMQFNFPELIKTIMRTFGFDPNRYFPQMMGAAGPGQMPMGPGGPMPVGPMGQQGQPGMNPQVMSALGGLFGGGQSAPGGNGEPS